MATDLLAQKPGTTPDAPRDLLAQPHAELSPFPVDAYANHQVKDMPPDEQNKHLDGFTSALHTMARPWISAGYTTASSLNRGIAHTADTLDLLSKFVERTTGMKHGGIFEKQAEIYTKNADYWKGKADKEGIGFFDELLGEAVGGAVPGAADFALKVASGFTISAVSGAEKAMEHDQDPFIGGLIEAAKTGTLATVFKMAQPFSRYMQATMLGSAFAVEGAVEAPAGQKVREAAKGFGTGMLMSGLSSSGGVTLKKIYSEIGQTVPEFRKSVEAEIPEAKKPTPTLRPAIKTGEDVTIGAEGQKHDDLQPGEAGREAQETEVKPEEETTEKPKEERGFVASDNPEIFMNRDQSAQWMEKNDPETFKAWEATRRGPELHSEDYNQARSLGSAAAGFKPPLDDIDQLTQSLDAVPKTATLDDRLKFSEQLGNIYTGVLAAPRNAFEQIKRGGTAVWDWYKNSEVKYTDFDKMFDAYIGGIDIAGMKTGKWAGEIIGKMSKGKRKAVANYVAAGGREETLRQWADATEDPALKKGYEDALNLSGEEKTFGGNIRQFYDAKLEKAVEADLIGEGIEDYVNQVIKKNDPQHDRFMSEVNAGLFKANPSLVKKRVFEHFFDGEQAGYQYEKDIGKLITIYENSFNKAILTRKFIKDLPGQDATDGKPLAIVSGSGREIPPTEKKPNGAYLINPRTVKDEDYGLYREIPHSAFRGYKWVGKDGDGKPIFLQGDLLVHKEAYKKLSNSLKKSAIRQNAIGAAVLKGSQELKGTLLSLSPFHQATEIEHALGHKVNPWATHKLDPDEPIQRELIEHSLKVYSGDASSMFDEGLFGSGLIEKFLVVGELSREYKDYLFKRKIPEIKMNMAIDAFERNSERYPELNRDQLLHLSADQANHAFGELNYKSMGRNPTMQDVFRLVALAPDFLEARAGFALQAVKPYGKEQAAALVRLAVANFVLARIIGATVGDEKDKMEDPVAYAKHAADHPFSVVIDDKEYGIRTVPGDIAHLVSDPRSFFYHRLNPATLRPVLEGLTSRDYWGRKKDFGEQVGDYFKGFVPIPLQGLFKDEDYSLWDSMLQSIGVTQRTAVSDEEKEMMKLNKEKADEKKAIQEEIKKAIGPGEYKKLKKMQRQFSIRQQE